MVCKWRPSQPNDGSGYKVDLWKSVCTRIEPHKGPYYCRQSYNPDVILSFPTRFRLTSTVIEQGSLQLSGAGILESSFWRSRLFSRNPAPPGKRCSTREALNKIESNATTEKKQRATVLAGIMSGNCLIRDSFVDLFWLSSLLPNIQNALSTRRDC